MKTLRLALDFSTDEANELTVPVVRIYVTGQFPKKGDPLPEEGDPLVYLSKDCAFASELDEAVNFLKGELDKIKEEGHRKFAAARR